MLSDRITELFHLLQCSNSDIARFAQCSPSNISRLKSGTREPEQSSRSVLRLAQGIYRYADYEKLLSVLGELCGTKDTQAEVLLPAIIRWLYEDRNYNLPQQISPRSKRIREKRLHSFGQRLDKAMTLLEFTNGKLAAELNVDVSLISRYRSGIYHPGRNMRTREHLCEILLARAVRLKRSEELAACCSLPPEELCPESLAEWLFEAEEDTSVEMAESFFRSISAFTPGEGIPSANPVLPPVTECERYWGTPGLKEAVIRFLSDAAREGGELLLYSDEPMAWMSQDRNFFAIWAFLMVECVNHGVRIRIIHNLDRSAQEMISALNGWLPLYISGMIEPYIFRKSRNVRFFHTIFLRPGRAGIFGFFPTEAGEKRWYDYITETDRLDALQSGFDTMLAGATPFLKTYPAGKTDEFWALYHSGTEKKHAILNGLSTASMPEKLLLRMLSRAGITGLQREKILTFCRKGHEQLAEILKEGELHEFISLPNPTAIDNGIVPINLGAELLTEPLTYTPAEYTEHIRAICGLIEREKNYHLTLLPFVPFPDLQIFTMQESVGILRSREPCTAFMFTSSELVQSVALYCETLLERYSTDRYSTIQKLRGDQRSCREILQKPSP